MACDYQAIRADNERRYGTDIGRIGPMLLADRYADRAHFIFELLQNAEDALARRDDWQGSRAVTFRLSRGVLRVSHFGRPFDPWDVRGICGIAEGTKDLTLIGRFGIGFKSVYAFTDRPEVHSGDEDFAIENFVWPVAASVTEREEDETVLLLPLPSGDSRAHDEIARALQRLGPRTLLFLRQIEEIDWAVEDGSSGLYLRSTPKVLGENVRRLTLIGQLHGDNDVTEEDWLVCSREVRTPEGAAVGHVEIAFSLAANKELEGTIVRPVQDSPLVVFFPTVLSTHLGFLVQGPYRTTPSRDNVPRQDTWNQHLVRETAILLVEALGTLRELGFLNTSALSSLPLDRSKFGEGQLFAPLFEAVREALSRKPLLPRFACGHASAKDVRLARTQDLRELLDPAQLGALFGDGNEIFWASENITQDCTPELRQYLMRELGVTEVTPETLLPRLDMSFLEAQPDNWLLALYEFLSGQPALLRQGRLTSIPLIRLWDGRHVAARANGQPQAFLPSAIETGFPTVHRAVCATDESRKFLQSLGLTEPDPVDDVVWNVLPKYAGEAVDVGDEQYEIDIRRIVAAFGTDSKGQREKLLAALRGSSFVMAVDTGDGSKQVSKPGDVYLATQRLKDLLEGVPGVLVVSDSYACLRGEDVRELLEACGVTRYLLPVPMDPCFTWEERREMRHKGGWKDYSREGPIEDYKLRGLDKLLARLPALPVDEAATRARHLWEALGDVEDRRGRGAFSASYVWYYYQRRSYTFDAAFIRDLNATAWVPDGGGSLQRPEFVVFDALGWEPNPFLQAKIRFKPPVIEALAREAGIDPGLLDLLKKLGVTSEADLRERLRIEDEPRTGNGQPDPGDVDDAAERLLGKSPQPTPAVPDPAGAEQTPPGGGGTDSSNTEAGGQSAGSGVSVPAGGRSSGEGGIPGEDGLGAENHTARSAGARPFISYVGTDPDEEGPDPDGMDHQARVALEERAIGLILAREPELRRTATNNPGFDLFADDASGVPGKWVEVKAMTGTMQDRPVGVSRTQFECAREHGDAYWLYVVEFAGSPDQARIVRIQDPAGKARTFTFDHGWLSVAEVEADQEDRED